MVGFLGEPVSAVVQRVLLVKIPKGGQLSEEM
jgi:hypothetical protein